MTFTPTISEETIIPLSLLAAGVALVFVTLCEILHARRGARVARLAFGPEERSRAWTRAVPVFRTLTVAALTWSLAYLLLINALRDPLKLDSPAGDEANTEELVFVLDYSPSMWLEDSGKEGTTSRRDRMAEVISAILDRTGTQVRHTLICFYTKPLPVVQSAFDKAIVRNVLADLPIERAMTPGKTDLNAAIERALEIARGLAAKSTTLIVATDGDTDSPPTVGELPESIKEALVLGVGDKKVGQSIDGHLSRQDADLLEDLANDLNGQYLDVNREHVPASAIAHLLSTPDAPIRKGWTLARMAYTLFIALAALYALLPLAQEYFASNWRPGGRLAAQEQHG